MLTFKPALIIALLGTAILYSCQKESLNKVINAQFDKPFKLGFNEKSYLNSANNALTVEIKNISDQRCTIEEGCENEGSASVRFSLSNLKNASGETILSINKLHIADSTVITLNNTAYLIKLMQVSASGADASFAPAATISVKQLE